MLFKVIKWVFFSVLAVIVFIFRVAFEAWTETTLKSGEKREEEPNSDKIWSDYADHYYDKDPPPPFQ